jgi:hypothetical protein
MAFNFDYYSLIIDYYFIVSFVVVFNLVVFDYTDYTIGYFDNFVVYYYFIDCSYLIAVVVVAVVVAVVAVVVAVVVKIVVDGKPLVEIVAYASFVVEKSNYFYSYLFIGYFAYCYYSFDYFDH